MMMAEEAQEEDHRTGAKTRANRLNSMFVFAGAKCVNNAGVNLFWLHMMQLETPQRSDEGANPRTPTIPRWPPIHFQEVASPAPNN